MTDTATPASDRYEIVTVPCLTDNYAYLIHDSEAGTTTLIDAPEAVPVRAALDARDWRLSEIVLTHHHADHVQAVSALRAGTQLFGAAADAHRLPELDVMMTAGQTLEICGTEARVIAVPGHTSGHIALYFPALNAAFTADSLMTMGCGRLSEGTADQMWQSLQRLADLPPETLIYSGHEYTATNVAFAQSLEPDSAALKTRAASLAADRDAGRPTVPSTLADESQTNPFLRAAEPELQRAVDMEGSDPSAVFAEVRARKDAF